MRTLILLSCCCVATDVLAQFPPQPPADCAIRELGYWNGAYYFETTSCLAPTVSGYGTSSSPCTEFGCSEMGCRCYVTPTVGKRNKSALRFPDPTWIENFKNRVDALHERAANEDVTLNPRRAPPATALYDEERPEGEALRAFIDDPSNETWNAYKQAAWWAHVLIDNEPLQVPGNRTLLLADGLFPFDSETGGPLQGPARQPRDMPAFRLGSANGTDRTRVIVEVTIDENPTYFVLLAVRKGRRIRIGQQVQTPDGDERDPVRSGTLKYKGTFAHTIRFRNQDYVVSTRPEE